MSITIAQAIFVIYLLLVLAIGVIASRFTVHTPSDFYLANRRVGTLVLGLTFVATVLSAFTVLGIGGQVFTTGLGTFSFLAIAAVGYTLVFATVGVTLYAIAREMDVVTPSEYVRKRYDSPMLGVLYLSVTGMFMIALITGQLTGGGIVLDALMDIPYELAITVMAVFMLVYIHIAGYRGVIWSDTLQSIVLFGALGGVVAYVLIARDANEIAIDTAEVTDGILQLAGPLDIWTPTFIITFALAFVFGVPAYPHTIQRYFSGTDAATVHKSGFVFAMVAIPIYLFGAILGFWAIGMLPDPPDPDWVVPLIVDTLLHPVVFGVVMASATAAIMSTADSVALTMSSMISRGVYVPFVDPEANQSTQVRVTQMVLIVTILLGLILAWIRPAGIFAIVAFAVVGLATTSAPIFFGAYWRQATAAGAAVSLIVGPGLLIVFEMTSLLPSHPFGIHHGFISLVAAYVLFIGVSSLSATPSAEAIQQHSRRFLQQSD